MSDDLENIDEIVKKMKGEDQFLEFKEEFRERDKIKLRDPFFGEPISQNEIDRYLMIKDRLARLLREKREQQGLVYVLHLKKKNNNIDEEIKKTGDEYSSLLAKIRGKTGYSNEDVIEYIEGGRTRKIEYFLKNLVRENEEELKDKTVSKKNLYSILRNIGREKKSRALVGMALIGTPIKVPLTGITNMLVSGFRSDFLLFEINQRDKNSGISLFKIALNDKKLRELKSISYLFENNKIEDFSGKEFELRNTKIQMPEPKKEEPKVFIKKEEKPIKKQEVIVKKEEPKVVVEEIKKEEVIVKKEPEPVKEEEEKVFIRKEKPFIRKNTERRNIKEKLREPETINVESFGVLYRFPKDPGLAKIKEKEKKSLEEKVLNIEEELLSNE